ncbi:hypothetical protein CCICO_04330 [Corynebacterium ciconiae DSM 44920]|uniref:hypothetical protein n=1 Tax=Corynebacterium ciconiae TaxID=227319 RepID=UPI0026486E61|nr:hypothetical protein [Corynebacterium ciconiae]WKD60903.1 hypothetical protein CCICO_04330 [Corynebacterium ciconiae DSM 44920]
MLIEADVNVDEYLDEADEDALIDELRWRGYVVSKPGEIPRYIDPLYDRDTAVQCLIRRIEEEARACESLQVRGALHWVIGQINDSL